MMSAWLIAFYCEFAVYSWSEQFIIFFLEFYLLFCLISIWWLNFAWINWSSVCWRYVFHVTRNLYSSYKAAKRWEVFCRLDKLGYFLDIVLMRLLFIKFCLFLLKILIISSLRLHLIFSWKACNDCWLSEYQKLKFP